MYSADRHYHQASGRVLFNVNLSVTSTRTISTFPLRQATDTSPHPRAWIFAILFATISSWYPVMMLVSSSIASSYALVSSMFPQSCRVLQGLQGLIKLIITRFKYTF